MNGWTMVALAVTVAAVNGLTYQPENSLSRSEVAMPISYTIDHERQIIVEVWTGDVSAADLAMYWQRYLADASVLALRRTLVDMRGCTITFSGDQLANLIETIVLPILGKRVWRTALLVEHPVQYGVSRQYHVFAEYYSHDAIFHSYDEAVCWLLQ